MKYSVLILGGLLALAVAACGGGGGAAPGPRDVTVEGFDTFTFEPSTLEAEVGQTLNVTLQNEGVLEHSFVIDEFGVKIGPIAGGQSASSSFTPSTAGTYTFYCDVPGHREAGMVGTLTVTE